MTKGTATCYRQLDGLIQSQSSGWVVCPKSYAGLCCLNVDECLDEQICHNTKISGPGGSGYYIGLCTDPTYNSTSCSSRCTKYDWGDVTFNSSAGLWACCGTDESCDNPTNETFLAGSPQSLLAAASSQSSTTTASISVSSATVTATSTPSPMVDHISSLSEGAKAGIGVGVALAAVAIVALLAWVILLRKRLISHGQARHPVGTRYSGVINEGLRMEGQRNTVHEHELSGYHRTHEMEGR